MAKAYKVTSDPFYINGSVTSSNGNDYTEVQISAPLDSLNREGMLIHAVYFTSSQPDRVANQTSLMHMQVTTTSKTGRADANDANLLGSRELIVTGGAVEFSGPHILDFIGQDTAYQTEDALGIVATDDLFLALLGSNQAGAKSCQVRIVASRIVLEARAYAALVTNELSS